MKINNLRAQYAKLEKTNNETNQNAKKVSEELKQVKEDFNLLLDINTTYKMENDELKRRIRSNLSDDECSDLNIKKIAKKKVRKNMTYTKAIMISMKKLIQLSIQLERVTKMKQGFVEFVIGHI